MLLKAAINGGRSVTDNPAVPITPEQLANDAKVVIALGVGAIHLHPRNVDGSESLLWSDIEPAIAAVNEACPGIPVGISTGDWIEPNVDKRLNLISTWQNSVSFASVNFHEPGAERVARLLMKRGIGVEAGLFTRQAAENLVKSGLAEDCLRIMFEPIDSEHTDSLNTVHHIEKILDRGKVANPSRLLHGFNSTCWHMLAEAKRRGYDSRIGFEDTLFLPDGVPAESNLQLVQLANRFEG